MENKTGGNSFENYCILYRGEDIEVGLVHLCTAPGLMKHLEGEMVNDYKTRPAVDYPRRETPLWSEGHHVYLCTHGDKPEIAIVNVDEADRLVRALNGHKDGSFWTEEIKL